MRYVLLGTAVALALLGSTASIASQLRTIPVCSAIWGADQLIGQRVRVEGYILSLGSHGFVLASKRRDCKRGGQLGLQVGDSVINDPSWRRAFRNSLGPKRATVIGTVKWREAGLVSARNPALTVERVQLIGERARSHTVRDLCHLNVGRSVAIGSLSSRVVFGPPNYGENPKTDSKETIYLLRASRSCLRAKPLKGSAGDTLQLVGEKVIGAQEYVGKKVVVRGEVLPAESAHHHTRFVVDASQINRALGRNPAHR
jgi:Domain of unknown function (DUF4431)